MAVDLVIVILQKLANVKKVGVLGVPSTPTFLNFNHAGHRIIMLYNCLNFNFTNVNLPVTRASFHELTLNMYAKRCVKVAFC